MLIGATMLYNAYIISQGKRSVSTQVTQTLCLWGRQDLWKLVGRTTPPPHSHSQPGSFVLLILDMGGGTESRGPLHTSCLGLRSGGVVAGQSSSPSCPLVPVAQETVVEWMPHLCFEISFLFVPPPLLTPHPVWQMGVVR